MMPPRACVSVPDDVPLRRLLGLLDEAMQQNHLPSANEEKNPFNEAVAEIAANFVKSLARRSAEWMALGR
jgi:hypothetical protein